MVFESLATDLVDNISDSVSFTDIFARPMSGPNRAGPVEWLTRDAVLPAGGNQSAALEDVSADGRYVAWRSAATNYVHFSVVSDTNGADDVFVRDRVAGGPVSIKSVVPIGAPATANAASGSSTLLSAGQAAFFSDATNLLVTPPTSGTNIFAPVPSFADLSVSIADAPDPALVGQQVVYTFTVANARASGGNRGRAERARPRRGHGPLGRRRRDAERRRRQVRPGNAGRRRDRHQDDVGDLWRRARGDGDRHGVGDAGRSCCVEQLRGPDDQHHHARRSRGRCATPEAPGCPTSP